MGAVKDMQISIHDLEREMEQSKATVLGLQRNIKDRDRRIAELENIILGNKK